MAARWAEKLDLALLPLTRRNMELERSLGLVTAFGGSLFPHWIENWRNDMTALFLQALKFRGELAMTAGMFNFDFPISGEEYDPTRMELREPLSTHYDKAEPKNIAVGLTPVVRAAYQLHPTSGFGDNEVAALAEVFA
jgi:hypothetical protein